MRGSTSTVFVAFVLFGGSTYAADWPQFRGPGGDGRCDASSLPTTWGGLLEPPAWTTSLPGTGWSSPIVVGRRIWVTAAEQTALDEPSYEKKLDALPFGREGFQTHAAVTLLAVELDVDRGQILRKIELREVEDPPPIHLANSYASPTPVSDGKRVYCHFGSLGTFCVAIDSGEILWQKEFVVEDITGPAGSPVLWNDRLFLVRDGCDSRYLVALNKLTGDELWRQPRPPIDTAEEKHRRAFSTPLLIQAAGRTQLIAPTVQWVVSYNPASGAEWWRARMPDGHALVPRPVYGNGLVYVCSGYHRPELLAVRVDGAGDVTDTHIQWTYDRQVPLISSPLVDDGQIYFVSTIGIATCLDAQTGKRLWQQRLAGNFSASPLLADGKLFFTSEEGTTTVLAPGREYRELARNQLFGQTRSSLAVARESLLIRTASGLSCVRRTGSDE